MAYPIRVTDCHGVPLGFWRAVDVRRRLDLKRGEMLTVQDVLERAQRYVEELEQLQDWAAVRAMRRWVRRFEYLARVRPYEKIFVFNGPAEDFWRALYRAEVDEIRIRRRRNRRRFYWRRPVRRRFARREGAPAYESGNEVSGQSDGPDH